MLFWKQYNHFDPDAIIEVIFDQFLSIFTIMGITYQYGSSTWNTTWAKWFYLVKTSATSEAKSCFHIDKTLFPSVPNLFDFQVYEWRL